MKAIVLLSGGIDSTVALAEAIHNGRECRALTFNYGQANWIHELDAASAVARHYDTPLAQCHIDGHFWRGSSFLTGGSSDPLQSYVPARNLLLLAHGIAAAEAWGAEEVWFGANADDSGYYPDCRAEFVEAVNVVAARGTKASVRIVAPHVERTKVDVVRVGLALGVPLELTTSCADASKHCGKCRGCILADEAYRAIEAEAAE